MSPSCPVCLHREIRAVSTLCVLHRAEYSIALQTGYPTEREGA